MNRIILIIVGVVILLVISAVLAYLLFFGTPRSPQEVFTNLSFQPSSQRVTPTAPPAVTATTTSTSTPPAAPILKQLTSRAVAGYTYVSASTSSSTLVRYVERGTGHIYQINPTTMQETLVGGTTIPSVSQAVFSPDGNTVAFTSYSGYLTKVFVGTIDSNQNVNGVDLPPDARNVAFKNNHTVYYTIATNGTLHGYEQNLTTKTQTELFAVNFTNFRVAWGAHLQQIYLITKPAQAFQSFIYTVKNNQLTPVGSPHFGMTALVDNSQIAESYIKNGTYTSDVFNQDSGTVTPLPIFTLSDKCTFDPILANYIWCAAPLNSDVGTNYVSNWYKGTISSNDYLWQINIANQQATLYADPEKLVNTKLDVDHMVTNTLGSSAIFTNKTDGSLWWMSLQG